MDNGRVKFKRLKDSQQRIAVLESNVRELEVRLNTSRELSRDLEWKLQRMEFRKGWAIKAATTLRQRAMQAMDSLIQQKLGQQGGNFRPEHGLNAILSKCHSCRGSGGTIICKEECEEVGISWSEYLPRFHEPTNGLEFWCEDCVGVGNTLSIREPL